MSISNIEERLVLAVLLLGWRVVITWIIPVNTFICICFNYHNTQRNNVLYFTMNSLLTLKLGRAKCPSQLCIRIKFIKCILHFHGGKKIIPKQFPFLFWCPVRTCIMLSPAGRVHSCTQHSNCKAARATSAAFDRSLVYIPRTLFQLWSSMGAWSCSVLPVFLINAGRPQW